MIKFADLRISDTKLLDNVLKTLQSGNFINGPFNDVFAKQWANECGTQDCVLTSSGTAAIQAVLHCIAPADYEHRLVIIPALSFAATAFAALEANCKIIYVDVNERGLIRWDQALDVMTTYGDRILTVMSVWLYGQACYAPTEVVEKLTVVDDACQAHGVYKVNPTDHAIGCFSFYPSKNLGALGDAGAAVFNNLPLAAKTVAQYCNYGDPPGTKYVHEFPGNNLRCDHIQAAYLSEAYKLLEANNTARLEQSAMYTSCGIRSIAEDLSSWHLYPILVENPEYFKRLMLDYNIEIGNHYPYILPNVASGTAMFGFPNALHISRHVATLPIGPHLTLEDITAVASVIKDTCKMINGLWHIKG